MLTGLSVPPISKISYFRCLVFNWLSIRAPNSDGVLFSLQRSLYNAWISISKLYDSAKVKRIEMQHLKQNMKLISILNRQVS